MGRLLYVLVLISAFFVCPEKSNAAESRRTFDMLAPAELDRLSEATLGYYRCVGSKLERVEGADESSLERIQATYHPYIYIARQQCRISLLNVEKLLYSLQLNPEFVTNYVTTLREDVVYFVLQQALRRRTAIAEEEAWNNAEEAPSPRPNGKKVSPLGLDAFLPRGQKTPDAR